MTPGEFIESFDMVAEAPGGIERLRELVLQLAVRGRLVPQDEGEELASELLRRAKTAKIQEMIERKIRRDSVPELSGSAGEASSPNHWAWTNLHDFALVLGGKRLPAGASFSTEKTDNIYIRVTDMKDGSISTEDLRYISDDVQARIAKYTIDREDLYITIAGTIGDVGEVPEHFHGQNLTENAAKIVFREVDKKFLLLVLRSGDVKEQFQKKMKQMAQPKLALKRISGARVPIPPLNEQHRIVAKVNELMGLIDRLATTRRSREDCRTAARDSALAALRNASTSEDVETTWTRIAERMDDLFTAPADLVPLREAVLQLAVQGQLVPQELTDESASVLLDRIAKYKTRRDKRIKTRKALPTIQDDMLPFEIPVSWEWTHLGEITSYGATEKAESGEVSEETWVLELEDIEKVSSRLLNRVRYGVRPFKSTKNRFYKGDILYGKLRPYLDKVVLADEGGVCSSEIMPVRGFVGLAPQFIRLVLKAPYFVQYANSSTHGMNLPRLGTDKARQALFPLPPEAEQYRIVAKVDELMELIDRLERHLVAKERIQGELAVAWARTRRN